VSTALGLFGGTFDPVHFGHLRLALDAAEVFDLAEVIWIPNGRPPHRGAPAASPAQRLAMVNLALAGSSRFRSDDFEVRSGAPSYTVDSLRRYRNACGPMQPLCWILGADAFAELSTWHEWQSLFDLAHIAVGTRAGQEVDVAALPQPLAAQFERRRAAADGPWRAQPAGAILPFAMLPVAVSASQIRRLVAAGRDPAYLLPAEVLDYISAHHLYRNPA
jgi:nicotinate-nucleotide adenylyltransferase